MAAPDDHERSHGDAHAHGHSHVHNHDVIDWSAFRTNRVLQAVLGLVVVAAVATIIAIVALWPSDEGRQNAVEQGAQVGLGSERYAATVVDVIDGPCSYSTRERPQECRRVEFVVEEGSFAGRPTSSKSST